MRPCQQAPAARARTRGPTVGVVAVAQAVAVKDGGREGADVGMHAVLRVQQVRLYACVRCVHTHREHANTQLPTSCIGVKAAARMQATYL